MNMKRKTSYQPLLGLIVTFLVVFSANGLYAQVVAYTLTTNNAATGGIESNYPDKGRVMNIVGLTSSGYSGTNGQTTYGWNSVGSDAWVTSAFSTEGYISLSGSFQMKANTNLGPRDFKVQYSLNGSSWTDVETGAVVVLNSTFGTYNFSLPSVCDNKSTLYVRWVLNSTIRLDGGALSPTNTTHNASLKGVSIAGNPFAPPSTQASNISIISVTPTTIKLGTTNGNGNNRIFVINTVNSFTNPTDDYIPVANSVYAGSGEQVIYYGSGSNITVTVPSSSNEYWFRVYELNKMDNLTRFNTSTASYNPRQARLENIHTPTVTNIRLTRANLGATITTPTTGSIIERGIFWSTTSPVDETANLVAQSSGSGGVFVIPDVSVDRGTTIYFKAYVTNEYGTIMSEERSFSNVPVFTGTGSWDTPARWNVNEIPGDPGDPEHGSSEDSPVISGNCTLSSDKNVTDLVINNGAKLIISPSFSLNVLGTLTNNAGAQGLVVKASSSLPNGSLTYAQGNNVMASVEMHSKAYWNLANPTGSKYAWQYFGIPVTSLAYSPTFTNAYVREWDESVINYNDVWVRRNNGTSLMLNSESVLVPNVAYELVQQGNKTYTFTGYLNHNNYYKELNFSSGAVYVGQNMLSNPYTAAMNVEDMVFNSNVEATAYLYNTGTYNDWLTRNGEFDPGTGPGTYVPIPSVLAGSNGIPAQIPSMQGFMVRALEPGGTVSFNYNSLVPNSGQQRAKKATQFSSTRIDLIGNKFKDRMWVFIHEEFSDRFDNGYDASKLLAYENQSVLYGIGSDDYYQIYAVADVNKAVIGFKSGIDTDFKLRFNHENMEAKYAKLYLVDTELNNVTDITESGSEYSFVASGSSPENRFRIVSTITGISSNENASRVPFVVNDGNISVTNVLTSSGRVQFYDITGRLLSEGTVNPLQQFTIETSSLATGTYVLKFSSGSYSQSKLITLN